MRIRADPLASAREPWKAPSLTVMTCARLTSSPLPGARPASRLLEQAHILQIHTLLEALRHVNQCEPGHRRGRQGLHLHPRLTGDARLGKHSNPGFRELEIDSHAR